MTSRCVTCTAAAGGLPGQAATRGRLAAPGRLLAALAFQLLLDHPLLGLPAPDRGEDEGVERLPDDESAPDTGNPLDPEAAARYPVQGKEAGDNGGGGRGGA